MSYQKPYDPMAKILIAVVSVVLLGAIVVLLNNLFTTIQRNSSVVNIVNASSTTEVAVQQDIKSAVKTTEKEEGNQESTSDKAVETVKVEQPVSQLASAIGDNIRPIGSADASAKSASSATRSGEEIFNGVCTACHTTGVLEAPKLDDKAAWEPRMANGFDALVASAIKGKGNMPAKGGDASLSDDDVQTVVIYMLEKAGIDTGVSAAPATEAPAAAAPVTEAPVAAAPATEAPAAATPATVAPAVEIPATEVPTIPTNPTAPAIPETPATPETPTTPETPATPETPTTPAAPSVDQPISTSDATTANVPAATTVATAPAIIDNSAEAKKLYKTVCFTCHDAGVAGAPIVGNKEQWAPRIAQGKEALYHTSLNGKGAMPPKGGNTSLDDDLVKATVDYMISLSQ